MHVNLVLRFPIFKPILQYQESKVSYFVMTMMTIVYCEDMVTSAGHQLT